MPLLFLICRQSNVNTFTVLIIFSTLCVGYGPCVCVCVHVVVGGVIASIQKETDVRVVHEYVSDDAHARANWYLSNC